MKRHISMYKSIYFMFLVLLVSGGCSAMFTAEPTPTVVPTPTPEKLSLIAGEINACLLVSATEVETVSGIKVTSQILFPTGATGCRYISVTDDQVILVIFVNTDESLKKAHEPHSAVEQYELIKRGDLMLQDEIRDPEAFKVEGIDNLGDQAYFKEGSFLEIHVLKNKIYYGFSSIRFGSASIGYDVLMKLVKTALQRMP
jgi:hypothetical protein